jgi:hypothetical protein
LDVENEWCIKNDSIFYYPSDKTDINKRLKIVPTESRVLEVKGISPQHLIENVVFENLNFSCSDFTNTCRIWRDTL